MTRKLRPITENYCGEPDIELLQRKIAAAGEMKTAIKRALDEAEIDVWGGHLVSKKRAHELRKAMEDYLNA